MEAKQNGRETAKDGCNLIESTFSLILYELHEQNNNKKKKYCCKKMVRKSNK